MKLEKDHGGNAHIFVACTNFKIEMKQNQKFADKFDEVNRAKYKIQVYECYYKNYIECNRSKKICIK